MQIWFNPCTNGKSITIVVVSTRPRRAVGFCATSDVTTYFLSCEGLKL